MPHDACETGENNGPSQARRPSGRTFLDIFSLVEDLSVVTVVLVAVAAFVLVWLVAVPLLIRLIGLLGQLAQGCCEFDEQVEDTYLQALFGTHRGRRTGDELTLEGDGAVLVYELTDSTK